MECIGKVRLNYKNNNIKKGQIIIYSILKLYKGVDHAMVL